MTAPLTTSYVFYNGQVGLSDGKTKTPTGIDNIYSFNFNYTIRNSLEALNFCKTE
jgi:hypothetical protein